MQKLTHRISNRILLDVVSLAPMMCSLKSKWLTTNSKFSRGTAHRLMTNLGKALMSKVRHGYVLSTIPWSHKESCLSQGPHRRNRTPGILRRWSIKEAGCLNQGRRRQNTSLLRLHGDDARLWQGALTKYHEKEIRPPRFRSDALWIRQCALTKAWEGECRPLRILQWWSLNRAGCLM